MTPSPMSEKTDNDDQHGPGVRVHPPIIYGISIIAGVGLNNAWPLPMPAGFSGHIIGGGIITVAILLAVWSVLRFRAADTDVRPDTPDHALITDGPYRFSRNPLYIVLTLAQVTAAVWLDNLWVLLLTVASLVAVTRLAIVREERYLEAKFGERYLDYKRRVRRWL